MIPAILSGVFVIYLYRSLNGNSEQLPGASESSNSGSASVSEVIDRLSGLQTRLDALSRNDRKGAG